MSAPATVVNRRPPQRRAAPAPAPAPVPSPARAAAPPSTGSWLLPLSVVVVGMFMAVLDTSIVNVAIPRIQTQFGASNDDVQWVVTAYTLSMGVVVPVSGWLGDRFGLRRIYNLALVLFIGGSALCGVAWGLNSLILFRILQAVGGGLLPAISMAMVYRIAPRERIGMAMGLYGLGIVFAPALGPTLGGYLVEYVDWRLIFYINVPIGILGLVAALVVLPHFRSGGGQRLDALGFATICSSLFALLLALSEGSSWGWTSYRVLGLFAVGALAMAIFVVVELSVEQPMLDVRLFRIWAFTNSTLLIGILMAGLFAGFFYVPLFIQEGQGTGAFDTGLILLPSALVTAALMPISGRLYDRVGARWPAAIGLLITAYGTYLMHNLNPDTTRGQVVMWMSIRSLVRQGDVEPRHGASVGASMRIVKKHAHRLSADSIDAGALGRDPPAQPGAQLRGPGSRGAHLGAHLPAGAAVLRAGRAAPRGRARLDLAPGGGERRPAGAARADPRHPGVGLRRRRRRPLPAHRGDHRGGGAPRPAPSPRPGAEDRGPAPRRLIAPSRGGSSPCSSSPAPGAGPWCR